MAYNLDNYEPVDARIDAFWAKYPNGRVATDVLEKTETSILIKAAIYKDANDAHPIATGLAEEIKGSSPVNRVSWVENCETSAIGRALANANFAAKGKRPSREEMEKVERQNTAPAVDPALILLAEEAFSQIADINDVDELRNFYTGAKQAKLLNITVKGKTLNAHISARKQTLENVTA